MYRNFHGKGCENRARIGSGLFTHQIRVLRRDALERLDKDEDVVDADREDEEGEDLEDDHGAGDAEVAEEARGGHDGEQHDGQPGDGQGHLEKIIFLNKEDISLAETLETYYNSRYLHLHGIVS